jgi:hypothetical protein
MIALSLLHVIQGLDSGIAAGTRYPRERALGFRPYHLGWIF